MPDNKTHEFDAEIFSVGTYHGDKWTLQHLKDIVSNFSALSGIIKPPLKLGHNEKGINDGQPAFGIVKSLRLKGEKLVATLSEVPDVLFNAIKARRYSRVSSEIYFQFKHSGNTFNKVLSAVALLGADIPEVKNLADLQAFLAQAPKGGSFDKLVAFSNEVDGEGTIILRKEEPNMGDIDLKGLEEKMAKFGEQITSLTSEVADAKAETAKYKEQADKATAKLTEVEAKNLKDKQAGEGDELKAFCEGQVKAGKMLPAGRDVILNGLKEEKLLYSEKGHSVPVDLFKKFCETQGKVLPTKESAHHGEGEGETYDTAQEEMHAKVLKYTAEKKVDYAEGVQHILSTDKELAERYLEETNSA